MQGAKYKNGYNPLCVTLVFMFGTIVGMFTCEFEHISLIRNVMVTAIATVAFHFTHSQPRWLSKFFNKVS
jgi:hypothetical protein